MAKPKLPIMVDLETLSLKRNAAVIDIAMCAVTDDGAMHQWYLRPESYTNSFEFDVDPATINFHTNQKTGIMGVAEARGQHWRDISVEVVSYLTNLAHHYEIHLWSQGKDFDMPVLENLLAQAGCKAPWKYSNTHCLRDLAQQYPEVKRMKWGNHTAKLDVEAQSQHLKDLAAASDRVYRWVYGD